MRLLAEARPGVDHEPPEAALAPAHGLVDRQREALGLDEVQHRPPPRLFVRVLRAQPPAVGADDLVLGDGAPRDAPRLPPQQLPRVVRRHGHDVHEGRRAPPHGDGPVVGPRRVEGDDRPHARLDGPRLGFAVVFPDHNDRVRVRAIAERLGARRGGRRVRDEDGRAGGGEALAVERIRRHLARGQQGQQRGRVAGRRVRQRARVGVAALRDDDRAVRREEVQLLEPLEGLVDGARVVPTLGEPLAPRHAGTQALVARRDGPLLTQPHLELAVVAPAVALQLLGQLQDRARRPRVLDAPAPVPLDAAPGARVDVLRRGGLHRQELVSQTRDGVLRLDPSFGGGALLPLLPGALFVLRVLVVEARRRLAGAP